tara:strand:- start:782 stop:1462 length:681 start_codon:yes stop_codon:yes gene_type:complete
MNLFKLYPILLFTFTFVGLVSCKKTPAPDFHYKYFGYEQGRYVIYDVLDITHSTEAIIEHDTSRYQLKTVWGDLYVDNEGREGREFLRYFRDSSIGSWNLIDVYYGVYDGIRAELVEENQRKIKLVFAPTSSKAWDANIYNLEEALECYYDKIHQSYSVNGSSFDSTLIVEQADEVNFIDTIRKYEVYAKNVGLIYKYSKENDYQFQSIPDNGKEYYLTYVTHGLE